MPHALHREAQRFEREIATDLDARRVFLSGAGLEKNDVRKRSSYHSTPNGVRRSGTLAFRVEAKTTARPRYTLKTYDWYALAREADSAGEIPLFAVRFLPHGGDLVLARYNLAYELGCVPDTDHILPVRSGHILGATDHELLRLIRPRHLNLPQLPDVLAVGPYHPFMEALKAHALYAPND